MRLSSYVSGMAGGAEAGAWAIHGMARRRQRAGEDVMVLSIGDHDFTTDDRIVEAEVSSLRAGNHHSMPSIGVEALREAAATFHGTVIGETVGVENVAIVPGAQCGVFTAAQCVLDPGDEVDRLRPHVRDLSRCVGGAWREGYSGSVVAGGWLLAGYGSGSRGAVGSDQGDYVEHAEQSDWGGLP